MLIRYAFVSPLLLLTLAVLLSGCAQEQSQETGESGQPEASSEASPSGQDARPAPPSGGAPAQADPTAQPSASAEGEAGAAEAADEEDAPKGPDPLAERYAGQMAAPTPLLEDFRKKVLTSVPTNSNQLDDAEVAPSQLDPWAGELTDYRGKFIGPLDAELREVILTHRSREQYPDYLAAEIIYQREEVSETGMMEPVKGRVSIPFTKVKGSVIVWPKQSKVSARVGQFVSWPGSNGNTQQGLLIHSPDNPREPFTLLRKADQ